MKYILGFDFDNTLVSYDALMFTRARQLGWVDERVAANKREIRDAIRTLPDGENKWQLLQAYAYGPGMPGARLIEGVKTFLTACRQAGWDMAVVSHKSQFASMDTEQTHDLQKTARAWMEANRFFAADGLGLKHGQIYFEPTRAAKVARIRTLNCTHFVDDLQETFAEPDFPATTQKLLYVPLIKGNLPDDVRRFAAWEEIHEHFFAAARSKG